MAVPTAVVTVTMKIAPGGMVAQIFPSFLSILLFRAMNNFFTNKLISTALLLKTCLSLSITEMASVRFGRALFPFLARRLHNTVGMSLKATC